MNLEIYPVLTGSKTLPQNSERSEEDKWGIKT